MAVRRKGFEKYGGFGSAQPVHSPSAEWLWRFRHVMSNDEHHGGLLCAPPVQPVPKGLLLAPAKTVREGAQTTNESKPGPHRRSGAPPRAVSLHTAPLLVCVDLNGKGGSRHAAYSPTWSQRVCNGVPLARILPSPTTVPRAPGQDDEESEAGKGVCAMYARACA